MKYLGQAIEDKLVYNYPRSLWHKRVSARGIIKIDGKYLMIHSKFHGDLTFPGGGVEDGEDIIEGLKREVEEEAGVTVKNITPFYKTLERRIVDGKVLEHTSNFFICEVDSYTQTHLCDYEIDFGYEAVLVTLEEALEKDYLKLKNNPDEYNTVIIREIRILEALKEQ